jgi:hypothetical protein
MALFKKVIIRDETGETHLDFQIELLWGVHGQPYKMRLRERRCDRNSAPEL